MIRSVQPTSALPVTRNMPYITASVPSRNQPRNMTGIYLGLEGNIKPPKTRNGIPVTVRARGGMSCRIRTPAEDRRYKMVELLRIKEEKRGFKGQPVKRRKQHEEHRETSAKSSNLRPRQWGPARSANKGDFNDIIRSNPRNFTVVINSGVTRSENLTGLMSFGDGSVYDDAESVHHPDTLIEEVHRVTNTHDDLTGLEECYKKVCKGNMESLQSLLPLRRGQTRDHSFSTGFTVRSYRNPGKAEIMADFEPRPVTAVRPKTVPVQRQPLVPAPYFFRYYNKQGMVSTVRAQQSARSHFEGAYDSGKIISAQGTGGISRSLNKNRNSAWSEGDAIGSMPKRGTPRTSINGDIPTKEIGPGGTNTSFDREPLEIRAEGYATLNDVQLTDRSDAVVIGADVGTDRTLPSTRSDSSSAREATVDDHNDINGRVRAQVPDDGRDPSTIKLEIENEDGKTTELHIDKEEINDVDNVERLKASEAKVASMKEDAEQRRRKFEQILDEHAEILNQIPHQATSQETAPDTEDDQDQQPDQ